MASIVIKNRQASVKLSAYDRDTLSRAQDLLGDLSFPGSPVAEQAEAVKKPLDALLLALSFPLTTEGSTNEQGTESKGR